MTAAFCARGHEMTPANTIVRNDKPGVRCRTCVNARQAKSDARRTARFKTFRRGHITAEEIRNHVKPELFWSRVGPPTPSDCWEWTGSLTPEGYGRFASGTFRSRFSAHRVTWALSGRDLIRGEQLDHLCRNRRCVNPAHLESVSPRVNNIRSMSASAVNARKTCCKRGHEFTTENTYRDRHGKRYCRTCRAEYARERYVASCAPTS